MSCRESEFRRSKTEILYHPSTPPLRSGFVSETGIHRSACQTPEQTKNEREIEREGKKACRRVGGLQSSRLYYNAVLSSLGLAGLYTPGFTFSSFVIPTSRLSVLPKWRAFPNGFPIAGHRLSNSFKSPAAWYRNQETSQVENSGATESDVHCLWSKRKVDVTSGLKEVTSFKTPLAALFLFYMEIILWQFLPDLVW